MRNTIKFRFAGLGIMLATCAVFGVAVMLLWNALIPQIFGLPQLNYLQAAGLLILARVLFGGIGGGGRGNALLWGAERDGHSFHHGNKLREKWMNMSEDERLEFIKRERGFAHWRGFYGDEEKKDKQGE
jgi:hypothetical protein